MTGKNADPLIASRVMVYVLSQALGISPLEAYELPVDLFIDMLTIHGEVEGMKAEEMQKVMRKHG